MEYSQDIVELHQMAYTDGQIVQMYTNCHRLVQTNTIYTEIYVYFVRLILQVGKSDLSMGISN